MLCMTNPVAKVAVEGCDLFLIWALAGTLYVRKCGYIHGILHTCRVRWPCPYDEGNILVEDSGSSQGLSTQSMLETGTAVSV